MARNFIFRHDIEIAGISSDGDARLLVSMKQSLHAICNQLSHDVLSNLNYEQYVSFIQDSLHLATKLRNRLLKISILLPMGLLQVSVAHLKILIKTIRKEIHGLVLSDICPEDRQNYASFEKISTNRVLTALTKYVPDSEATVKYLKLSSDFIRAFTEPDLTPLDRVLLSWRALFFFRAWHKWIKTFQSQSVKYNLDENFISQNAFTCLEINAYALLHLIKKFRNANQEHLFLLGLFNSQPCESTFRQFRSMTTANWTKINFSLLELLHMISRIELQNQIAYFELSDLAVLTRIHNRTGKHKLFQLPSDCEMRMVLEQVLEEAVLDAAKFGIIVDAEHIRHCEILKGNILFKKTKNKGATEITDKIADNSIEAMMDCSYFRDYSAKVSETDGNSRFIHICDENGFEKLIRKSAIVNMLSDSPISLSKDRLQRVKLPKEAAKKNIQNGSLQCDESQSRGVLQVLKEISVGQWCLFGLNIERKNIIIGNVLGFRYVSGRTQKERQFSLDTAPVSHDGSNERGLEVLALWYQLKEDFFMESLSAPSFFNNIDNYLATVEPPSCVLIETTKKKSYKLSGNIDEIKLALGELLL